MKKVIVLISIILLVAGCGKKDDEEEILNLINNSIYLGDGTVLSEDEESPRVSIYMADTLKDVKWRRVLDKILNKHINIDITGDSAFITVDYALDGTFYVINSTLSDPSDPYERVIADTAHREIIAKKVDGIWRIHSITPLQIWTKDTPGVRVEKVEISASPSGRTFTIEPGKFYTKEELPIFDPGDTVTVIVHLNIDDGKGWVFLHHGMGWRRGKGVHRRKNFYKEDDSTFTGSWVIQEDNIRRTPALRNGAVDAVGWEALFGDGSASYNAHALFLPYIIKKADEEIPGDTDEEAAE